MDLTTLLTTATEFFLDEPFLRLQQAGVLSLGALLVYLILYSTRDILLRTNSLLYMLFSILLVTALPIVGFLLYLLIRPARTIAQRELSMLVNELAFEVEELRHPTPLFSSHEVPKSTKASTETKQKKKSPNTSSHSNS
jgi:hypothetical protein